jgi:cell division protein FtsA
VPAKGVRKGSVVDAIDLVGCVTGLMKNLKAKSGINIKLVYTNISGDDIITKHIRAILPLAERGNKVITASDIQRAHEQARVLGSSLEEEIIQQIPASYAIDTKTEISNPLGLYSHKLEVDLYLVCVKLSNLQSLSRVINQSGYEIKDLSFSGLATSKVVLGKEFQEGLNLFCDIGADITELLVFRDGILKDMEVLDLGGNDLTAQIQESLKIPFDLAEDIKRSHGIIGDSAQIKEDKEILLKRENLYKPIKERMVSEIITAQAKLIASSIKASIEKRVSLYEVNNLVVVGRTVLLEGFIETLENVIGIPVKIGRISDPEIFNLVKEDMGVSAQKYLMYLAALGLLCEAKALKPPGIMPLHQPAKNFITKTINRFKEVYQEYF